MTERVRPYIFYDVALTICSTCFRKLEGKIVFQDGKVFLLKRCPAHGAERVLVADDIDYFRRCREVFIKRPEMPLVYNTPVKWGCPYDCGREALMDLRGADLRGIRERALERLNRYELSTTLVATLKKGLNDGEIGKLIDFALTQPCVRGVTLQPIQDAGRLDNFDPATDRLTLTEVRRKILEQTGVFRAADVIPVPCHPDALGMAYALKLDGKVVPLTGLIDPQAVINGARNTIVYEEEASVRDCLFKLFATNHSPESGANSLRDLLCCLPRIAAPAGLTYKNIFRVLIVQFLDAHAFDVRSVKKTCIHIVHPDGRLIPFDTYNLFYRDALETTRLAPLRQFAAAPRSPVAIQGAS